jgi:hypothetical protein
LTDYIGVIAISPRAEKACMACLWKSWVDIHKSLGHFLDVTCAKEEVRCYGNVTYAEQHLSYGDPLETQVRDKLGNGDS